MDDHDALALVPAGVRERLLARARDAVVIDPHDVAALLARLPGGAVLCTAQQAARQWLAGLDALALAGPAPSPADAAGPRWLTTK